MVIHNPGSHLYGGTKRLAATMLSMLLGSGVLAVAPQDSVPSKEQKNVTAEELLDAFRANQDLQCRFILIYEMLLDEDWDIKDPHYAHLSGKHRRHQSGELRYDGVRYYHRETEWTESNNRRVATPRNSPRIRTWIRDDSQHTFIGGTSVILNPYLKDDGQDSTFPIVMPGHDTRGYLSEAAKFPFDEIIRGEDRLWIREEREMINGAECYVIKSIGKHGHYTVYIDPDHGYNLARAEVSLRDGDTIAGSSTLLNGGVRLDYSLIVEEYEDVEGVWVPFEYHHKLHRTSEDRGTEEYVGHFRTIGIHINPDFDALGSFQVDPIENGTNVFIATPPGQETGGARGTWKDGQVIDKEGMVIEY